MDDKESNQNKQQIDNPSEDGSQNSQVHQDDSSIQQSNNEESKRPNEISEEELNEMLDKSTKLEDEGN